MADQPTEAIEGTPLCADDLDDDNTNELSPEHLPLEQYHDATDSEPDEDNLVYVEIGSASLTDDEDYSDSSEYESATSSHVHEPSESSDCSESNATDHDTYYTDYTESSSSCSSCDSEE